MQVPAREVIWQTVIATRLVKRTQLDLIYSAPIPDFPQTGAGKRVGRFTGVESENAWLIVAKHDDTLAGHLRTPQPHRDDNR